MNKKKPCSIKSYLLTLSVLPSIGLTIAAVLLYMLGFGYQGTLVVIIMSLPFCFFSILYGFYKGLVKHYGFNEKTNLFFDGSF